MWRQYTQRFHVEVCVSVTDVYVICDTSHALCRTEQSGSWRKSKVKSTLKENGAFSRATLIVAQPAPKLQSSLLGYGFTSNCSNTSAVPGLSLHIRFSVWAQTAGERERETHTHTNTHTCTNTQRQTQNRASSFILDLSSHLARHQVAL
jgi:hypothetical protein